MKVVFPILTQYVDWDGPAIMAVNVKSILNDRGIDMWIINCDKDLTKIVEQRKVGILQA